MTTTKNGFQITIKPTGAGAAKFGPCEVCGKRDGAEWFVGKRLVEYEPGQFTYGDARAIGHTFGHRSCVARRLEA